MVLQLPRCAECGASLRSRDDEHCPFCGTVLPWDLWDEIAQARIELVETDALSFEAAIYKVEKSTELAGEALRAKRTRIRLRPRPTRRRTDDEEGLPPEMVPEALLWFALSFGSGIGLMVITGQHFWFFVTFIAGVIALGLRQDRAKKKEARRFAEKRKRYRERGHVFPLAAGVLEVGPPEFHDQAPDQGRVRIVVLHDARGNQHVGLAGEDTEVRAGDVGIATLRGFWLVSFRKMSAVAR